MEARNKILRLKQQRDEEKKKIKDAMFLQKQEEAKQAKMINQQNKQRHNQFMF